MADSAIAVVLIGVIEHVGAVRREGELEQRAGETAARLDQREEAARGHVEPLQRPLDEVDDLPHEPVIGVRQATAASMASIAPSRRAS